MFKKDPLKKLEQERTDLSTRAFHAQRNGDIRTYSALTAEAESLKERIDALKAEASE
ncbi:DUF6435 family protein [Congregibacter brevis]|uniref:DUF6435 family protein n=1 Tax=Congregibacter brevis TaxID=3081201 RepID=A0ABZ0I8W8_9GAMM|nr:DUF6435 family protein [Congregibacter sp. IMCC45268]